MSQLDLLTRATRAYREELESSQPEPADTRDRVVRTLVRRRRARRAGAVVSVALAVLLFSATTSYAVTGHWPELLTDLCQRIMSPFSSNGAPRDGRAPVAAAPASAVAPEPIPEPAPPADDGEGLGQEDETGDDRVSGDDPSPSPRPAGRSRVRRTAAPSPSEAGGDEPSSPGVEQPEEPTQEEEVEEEEPEETPQELYLRAHRLHFDTRNYRAALAAWERYIRAAPDGEFIMEARYNRAIDLMRLGRRQEAIEALRPFARGRYRGYRQREASRLIEHLERVDPTDQP